MAGGCVARIVPISGIVTAASASSSSRRLEVVVGAVDLVDQQHGGPRPGMLECAQQRTADEEVRPEQVLLLSFAPLVSREADAEQLAWVVPLVDRLGSVDAVVH